MNHQAAPQSLGFQKPRGIPIGPIIAIAYTAALAGWMLSPKTPGTLPPRAPEQTAPQVQSVRTIASQARPTTRPLNARGETRVVRRAVITSLVSGIVGEILVPKGSDVLQGDIIATLRIADFEAREAEASTALGETTRTLENTLTLQGRGLATESALVGARTAQAKAEADWARIVEEKNDMTLRAPFDGRINTLDIELGDALSPGGRIAGIIDDTRLIVAVSIPQDRISDVRPGDSATVRLSTGATGTGTVSFISAEADRSTRSFPVEILLDNPDGALRAGVGADVSLNGQTFARCKRNPCRQDAGKFDGAQLPCENHFEHGRHRDGNRAS